MSWAYTTFLGQNMTSDIFAYSDNAIGVLGTRMDLAGPLLRDSFDTSQDARTNIHMVQTPSRQSHENSCFLWFACILFVFWFILFVSNALVWGVYWSKFGQNQVAETVWKVLLDQNKTEGWCGTESFQRFGCNRPSLDMSWLFANNGVKIRK